jgi:glycosyltransferase involved in cell wall biosynthesis
MEAMAIGCPVVATSVGRIPELLQHGRAGAMVAGGDVTDLSDALMRVLSDDMYRRGLVDAGIRRVSELTPERVATMCLSCITEAERTRDPVDPRR